MINLSRTHQRSIWTSRYRLMLLVIGFHALPDFFDNLCSIDGTLCLKIIAFRIILVSNDDYLENHEMSGRRIAQLQD